MIAAPLSSDTTMTFSFLARLTAFVCAALTLALLFAPGLLLTIFSVDATAEAAFVARRTAMLFAGYAVLAFMLSATSDPKVQRAFSMAIALSMTGLAMLGLAEFMRGFAGPGIFVAIVTEAFFAVAYGLRLTRRTPG